MLRRNSSDSHIMMKSNINTMQKHKIRNLRAKLKTLLCNQSCQKNSKRQKIVQKIQESQNQYFYQTNQFFNKTKHIFTHTKQQPKTLWYCKKKQFNIVNIFGKLSCQEIQQIKEDMIYYLGEENVEKFKKFLEKKERSNMEKENGLGRRNMFKRLRTIKSEVEESKLMSIHKKEINTERREENVERKEEEEEEDIPQQMPRFMKNCSIGDRFFNFRNSFQASDSNQNSELNKNSFKRLKTANLIQSRTSGITSKSKDTRQKQRQKFQVFYLGNRQNFLQKRRVIQQQQNAQRIITKINMQMKQQKATDIFKVTQQAFLNQIKEKNYVNDSKTKQILQNKYKKNVRFGEIVELNQQLRKIYIKKISSNTSAGINNSAGWGYNNTALNFYNNS